MNEEITRIILENQNLVYKLAHTFEKYSNKEDLFQVGVMGILKAYEKFDSSFGVKFTTYAYPYILGEMRKFIREDRGIKVNRTITKLNLQIEKASILLSQKLMREPTIQELSTFLEVPLDHIAEALLATKSLVSIDQSVGEDDLSLQEVVTKEPYCDKSELIDLKNAIASLSEEERKLVNMRYFEDQTQSETASKLGMSQVQVSRSEQKVLTKLKQKLAA